MHMLFRRNFQRHGFQTNIYACGVDLFNKPSGILGAGEFFLKIVKAKAIVDTLVQNAAQFTVPLYNADGAAACLPGSIRSRQPRQDRRRSQQDHTSLSATSFGFFHQKPGRAAVLHDLHGIFPKFVREDLQHAGAAETALTPPHARSGPALHTVDGTRGDRRMNRGDNFSLQ